MSDARYLLRSSIARTVFAIAQVVIAFFMMPYLVRTLGERWYGIWVVISGLVGNYYLLDLGLAMSVTRFIARSSSGFAAVNFTFSFSNGFFASSDFASRGSTSAFTPWPLTST